MPDHQPTPEELTRLIGTAITARDFEAVISLLEILAVRDPKMAQEVYDTIQAGLAIAGRGDG